MKVGDKVEVMWRVDRRGGPEWQRGWKIQHTYDGWALIERTKDFQTHYPYHPDHFTGTWEKIRITMLRPQTCFEAGPGGWLMLEEEKLPPEGSWVMYSVPHTNSKKWNISFVVKQNKKTIVVFHEGKMLRRNVHQFVTMENPS